jgi:hypothetical protein
VDDEASILSFSWAVCHRYVRYRWAAPDSLRPISLRATTGQSLNLSPLDTSFAVVITDFENGPYDVSVIMLDSNRNPVGASGEASVTFIVNVSAPDAGGISGNSAASRLPLRLISVQRSRSLSLNVLRIAISYSRSVDAKM